MNILVTGSSGFVGRNLVENLKNIRDGKNRTRPGLAIGDIYEYDVDSDESMLDEYCRTCDFVFNLAGVNRPIDRSEFMLGNFGFAERLLASLKAGHNTCPVMLSSSIQASLTGRFVDSEYGRSKLEGERLFFNYANETGAKVLVYRFPNLFGKWCRPNYNSVVATFCYAAANDEGYTVDDRNTELELLYIDDLVDEMLDALEGREHRYGYHDKDTRQESDLGSQKMYCYVPVTHRATLGEIVDLLEAFKSASDTLYIPEMPRGSFVKKLYSTWLSYLPEEKISYGFRNNMDERGSFTELIKTKNCGQISVNVAKPGITRGQHWHNSKWEIFVVVSGHGLIQERKVGIDPSTGGPYPIHSFEVTGERIRAVRMLPGYIHSITNLSDNEDLVTIMWANEPFEPEWPDTFYETVEVKL